MEHKANGFPGLGMTPVGPCNILRVIATERSPDVPSEITAIAHIDLMLDDLCCRFGEVHLATFGRRTGGCLSQAPACGPADLARAVWGSSAPDVLISHDLCAALLAFPRAITGTLPWIGTLRVARTAWGIDLTHSPGAIIAAKNLDDLGIEARGEEPYNPAVREALRVASMVDGMLRSTDVRRWAADNPSGAHLLRPAFDEMAADFALQGMLDMSAAGSALPSEWPAPWDDDDVWRAVPLDDLLPYAGSAEDGSGGMALAEVRRRVMEGSPELLPRAPVLLRRVCFDIPEEGRCDGW